MKGCHAPPTGSVTLPTMAGKRRFEEQVSALDALREQPLEVRVEALRKALAQPNNFITAKAADLAREFGMTQLTPELLKGFDRFFDNPRSEERRVGKEC